LRVPAGADKKINPRRTLVCTDPEQVENKKQFVGNKGCLLYFVVKQEKSFSATDGNAKLSLSFL